MTITEFLEARIAEDEALALRASEGRFSWASVDYNAANCEAHGYRWSPSRVLAECAAKRAILKEHEIDLHMSQPYCDSCAEWWKCELGEGPPPVKYPCPTIKAIAAVYSDHADHKQEWK